MTSHAAASRARRWRVHAAWTVVVCAALAAVTWQVVAAGPITALDRPIHEAVDPDQPTGAALALCVGVARLGQRWLTVPLLLGLGAWVSLRRRDPRPLFAPVVGLASLAVLGTLLKVAVGRTPPITGVDVVSPGLGNVADWAVAAFTLGAAPFEGYVSYPSGHAANAALSYPLLACLLFGGNGLRPGRIALRRALWASAVPVLAVGVMMTALDYHWASEALGGWFLGIACALAALLVLGPGRAAEAPAGHPPQGEHAEGNVTAGEAVYRENSITGGRSVVPKSGGTG
ncbi:membrane-associated phospholipid phosphatase [Spinactinospora alkalitolerans]|uniref:Membrane-associated phospholipid phosphatase n=1 Tax=Spinactinospora alkalitolerans TaxID=687207 RepID=A0A852TS22_9ACTN|nr:phosphatase PAP2 family protein [Spinactinospora alkalitolerans]NYE45513.1 membrane-associated phospholipid phosphatase [Spinactinospora alkalitolerans]